MFVRRKLNKAWKICQTKGLGELKSEIEEFIRAQADAIRWELHSQFTQTTIVNLDDYKLLLHSEDIGISKELALYRIHEPQTTSKLKSILQPGFVVIDIGSNIGYYAILESLVIGKSGRVIAIEPDPKNYLLLVKNLKMNLADNVSYFSLAIGPEDGVGKLYITKQSNLNSMSKPIDSVDCINVGVRSLDSFVKDLELPRIDLVRMDIQGFESIAMEGMIKTLSTFHPRLLIELHCWRMGFLLTRNLLQQLKNLGYEVEYFIDRDEDFKWKKHRHGVHSMSINELIENLEKYRVAMVFFVPVQA